MADYRRALAIEPSRPTTLRLIAGRLPADSARLAILDSAIAADPSSSVAWSARANLLLLLGDSASARAAFSSAERLGDPGWAVQLQADGVQFLHRLGDTAQARSRMAEVLRVLPPSGALATQPGCNVVGALAALGDASHALDILDRIPRGAFAWSMCGLGNFRPEVIQQLPDPRLRRIVEENRPPWARP